MSVTNAIFEVKDAGVRLSLKEIVKEGKITDFLDVIFMPASEMAAELMMNKSLVKDAKVAFLRKKEALIEETSLENLMALCQIIWSLSAVKQTHKQFTVTLERDDDNE